MSKENYNVFCGDYSVCVFRRILTPKLRLTRILSENSRLQNYKHKTSLKSTGTIHTGMKAPPASDYQDGQQRTSHSTQTLTDTR